MHVEVAEVGARGIDSLQFSQSGTLAQAKALKASGVDFVVGYLGAVSKERLQHILDAGLAFMPCTFAATKYDGQNSVNQCKALGLPPGVTTWLDLEGPGAMKYPPPQLASLIDGWATAIDAAGYEPGLYVGAPQPLTSSELWKLKVRRYWNALSRETDRYGQLAEPKSGYCLNQLYPSVVWRNTGVFVDVNFVGKDFLGRLPSWVKA